MIRKIVIAAAVTGLCTAQPTAQYRHTPHPFKQLKQELATPNAYRNAAGAPGHRYYQQQADYVMRIALDDERQRISGSASIVYTNRSPDPLTYLWLQLDQNIRRPSSEAQLTATSTIDELSTPRALKRTFSALRFEGGFALTKVTDGNDQPLHYAVVGTMMRIDLPQPLREGAAYTLQIDWEYAINDRSAIGGRSGYEYFEEEDNYIYTIAQFFPRMCVYNDVEGWQNKAFLGDGEFALPFGNYKVQITVPSDHVVAATGELTNARQVLTPTQRERWETARQSDQPVFIVTAEEAAANEQQKATDTKTWEFEAQNVRDFAFACSRKFIWDAQGVDQSDNTIMAMSFYPKEGNPLWERYSTRLVAHTLKTYSKFTFDYPYPVAISVHTKRIGMEYPMICFNGGRPNSDGTYSERVKYWMQTVIIHEVGHNYFPMIVNSDERQWTWMDEGLNTFLQYLTEQEWERGYPSMRGPAHLIVDYMKGDKSTIAPIMTNSESILQFGNNAYGKPATALNILRETILGRELFDFAFKTYAQRWMFKHPTPADFFRTMEDASGIDLDWFWRGWFFTNDHCDIALNAVKWFQINTRDPSTEKAFQQQIDERQPKNISELRNRTAIEQTANEANPLLDDRYTGKDPYAVTEAEKAAYSDLKASLSEEELQLLEDRHHFYQMDFTNEGGLVMPLILNITFADESDTLIRIPAEIWRRNPERVSKVFIFQQPVDSVALDPFLETADCDMRNNYWPRRTIPSRFDLFEERSRP